MPAHHIYEIGKIHIGMTLADGTLLMPWGWDTVLEQRKPIGAEKDLKLAASVLRSRDGGRTWKPGGAMFAEVSQRMSPIATGGVGEPAMVLLPGGEIFTLLRTSDSWLYQSRSRNGGLTWDRPAPSPLAGHNTPAALWRLRGSGDVLVVWNNSPPQPLALGRGVVGRWLQDVVPAAGFGGHPGIPVRLSGRDAGGRRHAARALVPEPAEKNRELRLARFNRAWLMDSH